MDGIIAQTLMFDTDLKVAKQMRPAWWGVLCVFMLILELFDYSGTYKLAQPELYSTCVLFVVIALNWKLRRQVWFWITIAVLVTLHVPLILSIPWNTKWVPALAIIPIGIVDLYAMLAILSVVGKLVERPKTPVL